jgi:hypothetical protein
MKSAIRLATVLATMVFTALMTMPWAFAQKEYETPPTVVPTAEGAGEGGEVAFTGFRLTVWVALLVALVAIGAFALWAGRRRATDAKHVA